MPKMKTRRSAEKRFSKTASGKVKRRMQGLRHILTKKSRKTKNAYGTTMYLGTADTVRIKKLIPYV